MGETVMECYKISEINDHRYYKIPKELCENKCYRINLTSDAKLIYAMLLDRMELSRKNSWVNANQEIFLLYTKENVSDMLGISSTTVYRSFKQLETLKLIKQVRQGLNRPNMIFIGKLKHDFCWTCQICSSGPTKFKCQDISDLKTNDTYLNEPNVSETESSYISLPTNEHVFFNIYGKYFYGKFGKEHMRLTVEQLDDVKSKLNIIIKNKINRNGFEEGVKNHFDTLPESNNGNIIAFLTAYRRYFEIEEIEY
ncbi:replication initiator protein A [Desulfosporosinus sp.]|uniref:replication initiator protein A n=1 Tax=Desulfosporosinus sp. TaxID=157907 RepID=UPI00261151EF|nr:replication initiator protein A [Desulfosporosinus sp.]